MLPETGEVTIVGHIIKAGGQEGVYNPMIDDTSLSSDGVHSNRCHGMGILATCVGRL